LNIGIQASAAVATALRAVVITNASRVRFIAGGT
jgi:hypothetical protein